MDSNSPGKQQTWEQSWQWISRDHFKTNIGVNHRNSTNFASFTKANDGAAAFLKYNPEEVTKVYV
jgi:hypothetical protein